MEKIKKIIFVLVLFLVIGFIAIPKGKAISNNYRPLETTDVNKILGRELELKIEIDSSLQMPTYLLGGDPLIVFTDVYNNKELGLFYHEGQNFTIFLELLDGASFRKIFWSEGVGDYTATDHTFNFGTKITFINNNLVNSGWIYVCDKLTANDYIEMGKQQGYTTGYQDGIAYALQQMDLETIEQSAYNEGYQIGYNEGIEISQNDSYDNGWYLGYDSGYNTAQAHYGIEIDSVWKTATEYGAEQYNLGVSSEFNGFDAIISAVFLFISGIGNIEILPGIKMGYVIGLFLIFGIIAFLTKGSKK